MDGTTILFWNLYKSNDILSFIFCNARYIKQTSDQRRACTTWSLLKAIVDHSGKEISILLWDRNSQSVVYLISCTILLNCAIQIPFSTTRFHFINNVRAFIGSSSYVSPSIKRDLCFILFHCFEWYMKQLTRLT